MNALEINGNWDEQKSRLIQRFAKLINNVMVFEADKKDAMYGRLETKLGKTKEEIQKIADDIRS